TPEEQAEQRWRYWRGRAKLAMSTDGSVPAELVALARERQYYGFLAATRIGAPLQLNPRELPVDLDADAKLYARPGMQRIEELFALGSMADARREWQLLLPTLDPRERIAAIQRLATMGWIEQSVIASADPALTDYLSIRFPHPYG